MVTTLNALWGNTPNWGGGSAIAGPTAAWPTSSGADALSNRSSAPSAEDSLTLSEPLKALKNMGVDLKGSGISSSIQSLSFNLQFQDEQIHSLSSNGSYDLHSQSLQMDLSFSAYMSTKDPATGQERQELFQFDVHLEASHVQLSSSDQKVEKEDILQFARKILDKASKLHAEGKQIDGLTMDGEDLQDLASVDGGRLLKGILQILNLMRSMDRMDGKDGDHVWLNPKRGKALVDETSQLDAQSLDMSVSIENISSESAQAGSTTSSPADATDGPDPSALQPPASQISESPTAAQA